MFWNLKKIILFSVLLIGILVLLVFIRQQPNKNKQQLQPIFANSISDKKASKESCPIGFVLVPGNQNYSTSDFCAMKYDAKCAQTADPVQGIQPTNGSACSGSKDGQFEGIYKNNGVNCACRGDKKIVSVPSGFPVAFIPAVSDNQDNAKAYCQSQGWHLMTNPEWMTIARNVEQVNDNWCDKDGSSCGFSPGTSGKILANGHNDSNGEVSAGASSNGALIASNDDESCFGTTTDGSNSCGGKGSQKRTLQFSNGDIIWDFAGNVWHWVDAVIARKDQPKSKTNGIIDNGWKWSDFTPGSLTSVIIDDGKAPELGYDAFRPSDPSWNANNGVGRIYHFSSAADSSTMQFGFIRGGNWRHGYDSGAFTVHLSPLLNKSGIDDVGFRCITAPELQ